MKQKMINLLKCTWKQTCVIAFFIMVFCTVHIDNYVVNQLHLKLLISLIVGFILSLFQLRLKYLRELEDRTNDD